MAHTRQSFLIPQLNIVANDAQLKSMQKKMLFNHYAKQAEEKLNRSESEQKTYRNFYNPEMRADTDMGVQYMKNVAAYNKSFGIDLAESYKNQIQRKQAKKRQQRQVQKRQQEQMIRLAQSQLYLDKLRNQQIHESFRREAHEDLNQKQKRKMEQRKMQQLQKQMYQRRYSTNLLSLNKQQSFRKHYVNVVDSIEKNEKNYLNSVAPANKYKQYEKQRLIQNSIKQSENKLRQQLQQQFAMAEKHRAELRDSLVLQIKQKEQKKKQQINDMRSQGYTSNAYLHRHHPINNPVDFKITHDNRYIMKQLQSGLARSGSQSLI